MRSPEYRCKTFQLSLKWTKWTEPDQSGPKWTEWDQKNQSGLKWTEWTKWTKVDWNGLNRSNEPKWIVGTNKTKVDHNGLLDEIAWYVTQYASTFRYYIDEGNDGHMVR